MSHHKLAVRDIYDADQHADLDILGHHLQKQDAGADYLVGRTTYCWYHALAEYYKPKVIAEIGSRFGYSLKAMILGACKHCEPEDLTVFSFDNESYEKGCLYRVADMLTDTRVGEYIITTQDTQKVETLPLGKQGENAFDPEDRIFLKADLFHVDGDHSIQGTYHDLLLAKEQLSDGGVILLDDIDTPECPGVKAAMLLFVGDHPEFTFDHYPSHRGIAAIYKA